MRRSETEPRATCVRECLLRKVTPIHCPFGSCAFPPIEPQSAPRGAGETE